MRPKFRHKDDILSRYMTTCHVHVRKYVYVDAKERINKTEIGWCLELERTKFTETIKKAAARGKISARICPKISA